jgi:APA family basic amino acid/polyamine antiporter
MAGVSGATLQRRLGIGDAVTIGLGSMLGAGVFAVLTPAAQVAGGGLLPALAVAGLVAYGNATSSARLAARYPASGGTYVYGRERLGPLWGYLAGWGFVVGKTASCAAIALTFGAYVAPDRPRVVAAAAVLALTALNYVGVRKSLVATRVLVAATLGTLALVVVAGLAHGGHGVGAPTGTHGVLQAAGLLFFAFAGYARVATLGEEVRDPARTIPRAVPIALGITLATYLLVAVAALVALGPDTLAATADPLRAVVAAGDLAPAVPVVPVGAALATLGSLLALLLGVSRTTLAMARDRNLPPVLDAVHPRWHVPHRAEVAVGLLVTVLVLTVDLRGAIGFSSFAVLTYYAIANASALTLPGRIAGKLLPVVGLAGCLLLAGNLPWTSIVAGLAVLAAGAVLRAARLALRTATRKPGRAG